jgi:hypothetical protein
VVGVLVGESSTEEAVGRERRHRTAVGTPPVTICPVAARVRVKHLDSLPHQVLDAELTEVPT